MNTLMKMAPITVTPDDDEVRFAVYTNGKNKPQVQLHLSERILKAAVVNRATPSMTVTKLHVRTGYNDWLSWIEVGNFDDPKEPWMLHDTKILYNAPASLPYYMRFPADHVGISPTDLKQTACNAEPHGNTYRIYLPRAVQFVNNNTFANDNEFLDRFSEMITEARDRGITITDAGNDQVKLTRMSSVVV